MPATDSLILGVDGGGTKTDAYLARVDSVGSEQILGQGQAGSSNVKAVGSEQALAHLLEAVEQAWTAAQLTRSCVTSAVFGLSGAGRPETQQLIQEWAHNKNIAEHVRVVHDALPVLVAGTSEGWGVALIAGTGAVAFAADQQNNTAVSGGWGYWFGDEGSAFWLGQAAARAISHAADGRSAPTMLTQTLLNHVSISEPRDLLTALSKQGDVRAALAGLAELVSQCAEQGDATAQGILDEAAQQLAILVIAAAERLELGREFPLALAGGVACGSTILREGLIKELKSRHVTPTSVNLVAKPVLGCLRLASLAVRDQPN